MHDDAMQHDASGTTSDDARARRLAATARALAGAGLDRPRIFAVLLRAVAERHGDTCAIVRPTGGGAPEHLAGDAPATGPIGQVDAAAILTDPPRVVAPLRAAGHDFGVVVWSRPSSAPPFAADDLAALQQLADLAVLALAGAARCERLAAALAGRDELLAGLAHELRNPLGVITINSALLQRWGGQGPDGDKIHASADKIQRAARKLNEQLGEALDAARVERGELTVELAPSSLRDLLARALDAALPSTTQRRVELAAVPLADDLRVTCDEARILQLIGILIDLALRAATSATRITASAARDGDRARVDIHDGASDRPPCSAGGNMRLTLARGIAEAHGGPLTIAPDVMSFTLPLAPQR